MSGCWIVITLKKKIKELLMYILIVLILSTLASVGMKKNKADKKIVGEKIKVFNGEILEEMELEEYVKGVVSAEMPANFEKEALKAQAVCARTYTINKMMNGNKEVHCGADVCISSLHCQAYNSKEQSLAKWSKDSAKSNWDKISKAVEETKGQIMTYDGRIISALFHASSGGRTEDVKEVWGGTQYPYLISVESLGENEIMPNFTEKKEYSIDKVIEILKEKDKKLNFNIKKDKIEILNKTNGDRVKEIKFGELKLTGTEARSLFNLRSSNFEIKLEKDKVIFITKGYGHGAGMSQWGAQAMALNGNKYEDILKHYYTGIKIEKK